MTAAGFDPDAKMSQMGEDVATAEAEEAAQEAEAQAAAEAEAEQREKARIRREKKANMTMEDKKAKVVCGQYKQQAEAAKAEGALANEAKFEIALQLMEDNEWVRAELALRESLGSHPEAENCKVEETKADESAPAAAVEARQCEATREVADVTEEGTPPEVRVRFHIIGNACIENVGKSQSCMVSKLPIIWKQTVCTIDMHD